MAYRLSVAAVCRSSVFRPVSALAAGKRRSGYPPMPALATPTHRYMASAAGNAGSDPRLSLMDASCLSETQLQVRDAVFRVCADFPDVGC